MEEQKILEPTQLNAMIEKLKVAREDDTPHAVYGNGGEIAVVGDANKVADINSAIESGYLAANAL